MRACEYVMGDAGTSGDQGKGQGEQAGKQAGKKNQSLQRECISRQSASGK